VVVFLNTNAQYSSFTVSNMVTGLGSDDSQNPENGSVVFLINKIVIDNYLPVLINKQFIIVV
jgi:hypothetical protein